MITSKMQPKVTNAFSTGVILFCTSALSAVATPAHSISFSQTKSSCVYTSGSVRSWGRKESGKTSDMECATETIVEQEFEVEVTGELSVADIVTQSKSVLGLNKTDLSKLLNVSRMTLDRHVKGASVKDDGMERYLFVSELITAINSKYGKSLAPFSSNVLIDGKSFKKHLITSNSLEYVVNIASKLHAKSEALVNHEYQAGSKDFISGVVIR